MTHADCLYEEILGYFGWIEDLRIFVNRKIFDRWHEWLSERPELRVAQECWAMEQLL